MPDEKARSKSRFGVTAGDADIPDPTLPEYSREPSTARVHTRARKCLAGSIRTRASLAC